MGYQALLFCPDEKTARTVTQVLNELEFNVESCIEPFAAVKKLMGQHFDAVVVDCDNEQNATLLFKSARNSSSNQTSLAVAVVEGQAGVAKAFRIGANLVLTKPINIEQAKGTLRVARGLLRKSDPAKTAAPAATTSMPTAAAPAKPAPLKPISAVKPAAPVAPPMATPRPVDISAPKPAAPPAWPAVAAASAAPAQNDDELLEINIDEPAQTPVASAPAAAQISKDIPAPPPRPLPTPVSAKPAFNAGSSVGAGGAASAPAPARKAPQPVVPEKPQAPAAAETLFEHPATSQAESPAVVGSAPSFTFGGGSAERESEGGKKKIFVGVAAVVVLAAAYVGFTQFKGHASTPSAASVAEPVPSTAAPQLPKPAGGSAISTAPSSLASSATTAPSESSTKPKVEPKPLTQELTLHSSPVTKAVNADSAETSKAVGSKTAEEESPEPAPLIVKGGKVSNHQAKVAAAADVAAPSMIGIAAPGNATPPPNFVPTNDNAFKPVLQTLNISQGVSQGLLMKKVSPSYPPNALRMRVEGKVELLATVSKEGNITKIKALSGDGQLTKAASDAVKQWKYKPYLLNGEPVEIQTQVTVNFKLPR